MKYLKKVTEILALNKAESKSLMNDIIAGRLSDEEICGILSVMRFRGIKSPELTGFAQSILEHLNLNLKVKSDLLDICGTGGDGKNTFNISTAASLTLAAMGVPIAKHGNTAISSQCGSADVLKELGFNIERGPDSTDQLLIDHCFAFFFAPKFHQSFKSVGNIRKKMSMRTVFNLLGPLVNPVNPAYQVIGVFDKTYIPILLESLRDLGRKSAIVVSSNSGMDEFSIFESNYYGILKNGEIAYDHCIPTLLGIPYYSEANITGGDPAFNAKILKNVFKGVKGAALEIVALNAAAGLLLKDETYSFYDGYQKARKFLLSGKVYSFLEELL